MDQSFPLVTEEPSHGSGVEDGVSNVTRIRKSSIVMGLVDGATSSENNFLGTRFSSRISFSLPIADPRVCRLGHRHPPQYQLITGDYRAASSLLFCRKSLINNLLLFLRKMRPRPQHGPPWRNSGSG